MLYVDQPAVSLMYVEFSPKKIKAIIHATLH